MDKNGGPFLLTAYPHVFGIPMSSISKYIVGKVTVGARVGARPIVSAESNRVLADFIIRDYRRNTPKVVAQILDMLMKIIPPLLCKQVSCDWRCTCILRHVKTKFRDCPSNNNKNVSDYSCISIFLNENINQVYGYLIGHNTGLCRKTEETFG